MRKNIFSIALVAAIATAGVASAASNVAAPFDDLKTDGFIVAVDGSSVSLNDGKTYQLPVGFTNPGFAAGQKVFVEYSITGNTYQAGYVSLLPND